MLKQESLVCAHSHTLSESKNKKMCVTFSVPDTSSVFVYKGRITFAFSSLALLLSHSFWGLQFRVECPPLVYSLKQTLKQS